jgi:hypothetical protein
MLSVLRFIPMGVFDEATIRTIGKAFDAACKELRDAENSATPARVLEALARDMTQEVRSSVAMNISTPLSVLEVFAKDDRTARSNVAANPSTPASLLEVLATDKDPDVRACVAANPSTPLSLLEALAKDEKHFVRCRVRDRVPSIPSLLRPCGRI